MFRVMLLTAVLSVVALVFLALLASAKPVISSKTLGDLKIAYINESNANARYLEFAKKADTEGYKGVASLFRAAAEAEKVHSERFAELLKEAGTQPEAKIVVPKVGTTKENLEAAYQGETDERDNFYPESISRAEADKETSAATMFEYAKLAEGEHATLYSAALDNMAQWKDARTFDVCPRCGKTVEKVDFKNCPVCGTLGSKFIQVK